MLQQLVARGRWRRLDVQALHGRDGMADLGHVGAARRTDHQVLLGVGACLVVEPALHPFRHEFDQLHTPNLGLDHRSAPTRSPT